MSKWTLNFTARYRSGKEGSSTIFQLRDLDDCRRRLSLEQSSRANLDRVIVDAIAISPDGAHHSLSIESGAGSLSV
jgi:hypothetical protein